jgi:hypothetical protein
MFIDIVDIAQSLGIKVLGHVYLDYTLQADGSQAQSSIDMNAKNIATGIQTALQYPNTILGVSCGSEIAYQNNNRSMTLKMVSDCVSQFKAANVVQPVGYIDVATVWCGQQEYPCTQKYSDMEAIVDFIGLGK